jgi:hypothetical protein
LCECTRKDCRNCSSSNGDCACTAPGQTVCNCHPGWSDDSNGGCGCSLSKDRCLDPFNPNTICNGNGDCKCNACQCTSSFQGAFCQLPVFAEAQTGLDELSCSRLSSCITLDAVGHLGLSTSELAAYQKDCDTSGLKAQKRYLCFKVYNDTEDATESADSGNNDIGDIIDARATEKDIERNTEVGDETNAKKEYEEADGSSPACTRGSSKDFQNAKLKFCKTEHRGCKLEFWHDAIEGLDNYNMDTYDRQTSVYIKYYKKTNNSVIRYNDNVDLDFDITAVICPYYIDKWIIIGVVIGIFVLIFVLLFSVYFILINLYDRWEYQRFKEASKNIFETGNVKENPISRAKSRLSMRNIRNRLSRMSVRPS